MSDKPTTLDQEPPKAPKVQTFNLKSEETQTLMVAQANHQSTFAALLSLIVQSRMGYPVTQFTQFKLNGELTVMEISEVEPPKDVPVAGAPDNGHNHGENTPEEPKSPVVAA